MARGKHLAALHEHGLRLRLPEGELTYRLPAVDGPGQSLARGTGTIEADHLNGEIVLLGRPHGVPTPMNELLQRLANRFARERRAAGSMPVADLARLADEAAGPAG
jgi:Ketopantoate reductase PanE/ApbA C terminal